MPTEGFNTFVQSLPHVVSVSTTDFIPLVQGGVTKYANPIDWLGNWPQVNQTEVNPTTSTDPNLKYLGQLGLVCDWWGLGLNTNFSTFYAQNVNFDWLNGLNFREATAKTTISPVDWFVNYRGAGQKFMFSSTQNIFGMGDYSNNNHTVNLWGATEASGDEGQNYDRIVIRQGDSTGNLNQTTIQTVTTYTENTTITQAITKSPTPQAVTVASTAGMAVGDWVELARSVPGVNSDAECVKIQAVNVGAGTFTATFAHNHLINETVLGCTKLKVAAPTNWGQHRLLVNMSQPSYSVGTASIAAGTTAVTGIGTVWTAGMVGGDAVKIGLISFANDDWTGAPYGAGAARLRGWFELATVPTNTSGTIWIHHTYPSTGHATVAGAYEIRPGMRIEYFDGGGIDGRGGSIAGAANVILGNNSFPWTVGDTVQCPMASAMAIGNTGCNVYIYDAATTCNQLLSLSNAGPRTAVVGCDISGNSIVGGDPNFISAIRVQGTTTQGIQISTNDTYAAIYISDKGSGASEQHIVFGNGTAGATGVYRNKTSNAIELQMQGQLQVTVGTLNKGKLMALADANTLSNLQWGGYITPDNGVINTQTVLTSVTTILNTDKFQTYILNGATFALNLPAASGVPDGKRYTVKKVDAGAANPLTPNGADTIDGAASYSLSAQYKYVVIEKATVGGTPNWYIVANN